MNLNPTQEPRRVLIHGEEQELKVVTVIGHQWHTYSRQMNETYQSAEIYFNGFWVTRIGPEYGYGDHYLKMAKDYLHTYGIITGNRKYLRDLTETYGFKVEYNMTRVLRKKDL